MRSVSDFCSDSNLKAARLLLQRIGAQPRGGRPPPGRAAARRGAGGVAGAGEADILVAEEASLAELPPQAARRALPGAIELGEGRRFRAVVSGK